MGSTETWPLIMLWMLWFATALQGALAINGWIVEQREGTRISLLRVLVAIAIFLVSTVLTVFPTFLSESQPGKTTPLAPPAATGTQVDTTRHELDQIQQKLASLDSERHTLLEKISQLQQTLRDQEGIRFRVNLEQIPRQTLILGAAGIVTILLLIGFVVLAAGGQMQTLFPEGWLFAGGRSEDRATLKRDMMRLTTAVWQNDYKGALQIAERIPEKKLEHFDRLDFFFLRAYCGVQILVEPSPGDTVERRQSVIDGAIRDLEVVVESAPKRSEAVYLLALAYGIAEKNAESLNLFERAQPMLKGYELPFEHNESVCLLRLAELSLSEGNTEQAEMYFARVTKLRKLADSVVHSRLRIGTIDLQNAINKQEFTTATAALQKLGALTNLTNEQKVQLEVIRGALNARIALRDNDAERALAEAQAFLAKHWPTDLPLPDDDVADETFSPVLDKDLAFPREVFRGFLFIQAVALCRLEVRRHRTLSEAQVSALSQPLLRALQIDPRQRDLLGAIGGLYYWFRKDKRRKALDWLEAASLMGVSGRIVRKIIERDRLIEMEHREALDWFRSASSRFLRDPSLAGEVRRALVEELGRFQEFEPMLIELQEKPDLEPEEPTLEVIRERANYLSQLIEDVSRRGQADRRGRLMQIQAEYTTCLANLELTTASIATLERRIFAELGDTLTL